MHSLQKIYEVKHDGSLVTLSVRAVPSSNLLNECYKNVILGSPNVVVEWITVLLRIREVTALNLGPETSYPELRFSWFSSVPPYECRDITYILYNTSVLRDNPGGRLVAGIAGSNPARYMGVCLLCLYVLLSCVGRGLCKGMITCPEESYRVYNCV
jgi:hypothetical protein